MRKHPRSLTPSHTPLRARLLTEFCAPCRARSSCIVPAALQHLPERERDEFHRHITVHRYRAGVSIVRQGDNRTTLPLVCRGVVVSSLLTESGEEITLHTCGMGAFIGIMDWLLERPTFSCSVQALVETTLLCVRPAALLKAVAMKPELLATLLKQFGSQMHSIEHQFAVGRSLDAGGRILRCLLDLAQNLGVTDQRSVSLPAEVTRTRLAQLTGLARETVSRSVRKLARAGLIVHDDRRIVIPCVKRAEQALRRDRHRR